MLGMTNCTNAIKLFNTVLLNDMKTYFTAIFSKLFYIAFKVSII